MENRKKKGNKFLGFFKHRGKLQSVGSASMVEHPNIGDRLVDIVVILLCGLVAFCSLIPMWHVLMSSVSDGATLFAHKGMVWWPVGGFTLKGYEHIFQTNDVLRGYLNTIVYTITSTALGFFISITAGYAMSRKTKLKKFMINFVMITMLFGGGMVPTYMVINAIGWVSNPLSVIIPGCTNAMFLVMMMNAFNSIPNEMYEAARIDGAGHFRVLFIVMLPQAMNMGSVIILNSVVGQWNAWLNAQIYLSHAREWWPLQLFIKEMTKNADSFLQSANPDFSRYLIQFAAIIAATLPIIIVFPFFQNKMEKAVITGGVKE